jgi:signal transduction histidine kinase/PAS domain-containing protein
MENTAGEITRLQRCINDLISVLALPALWGGSESLQIVGTLLDVLLAMLRLDLAYARLSDSSDGPPIEVVRSAHRQHPSVQPQQVGQALGRWLTGHQADSRCVVPNPAGEGDVSIASFPLGLQDEVGVLVAGSRRSDFPTDIERLLLRVGANQAGIGLQEARRSGEQKRVAEALEQRVAERTRQLTAVNEELRRSEAYLAEAQRLSHTGSFGWRVSPGEIMWSEETFRIFEYDRTTESTVERVLQRVHPEDTARVKQTIERASQDGKDFDHEYRLVMPDGSIKYVRVVAHALGDESGGIEFVGAVMDMSEQHRRQMLLAGEKRLLEMIAKGESRALILDALCRLFEELAGGSLSSILLLDPRASCLRHGAAPSLPKAYIDAIDGLVIGPSVGSCGTAAYRREPVIVSDIASDPLWADYRDLALAHGLRACWSTPILSSEGRVLGTFATYYLEPRSPVPQEHDLIEQITHLASIAVEREQAEEALHQAHADLAHVNRVTTMGELTASLAHEVNQPIAAALTNANTCLLWLAGDTPNIQEARAAAMRIVQDGTRAAEIISRIRLPFKKGAPQREWVDVNELIREMIVLLRTETTRSAISVRTELAADLPQVIGDRVQLQQVMMNLIMNSIEATKDVDGTRELAITSLRADDEHLLVSVSDTGVGLPPQQADQIFNAFFTTKLQGTGLGLSISRSIVESHGGHLRAADNASRGASFHLTLPTTVEAHE